MGSPLDDALGQFDRDQAEAGRARQFERQLDEEHRQRFEALVSDFLSRMNQAGNPGAYESPLFPLKRWPWQRQGTIRIWSLSLGDYEGADWLHVAVDGRVHGGSDILKPEGWADYRKSGLSLYDLKLDRIGRAMAQLLRANGVS